MTKYTIFENGVLTTYIDLRPTINQLIEQLEVLQQEADDKADLLGSHTLSYHDGVGDGLNKAICLLMETFDA